jgi:hypothetical protein
VIWMLSVKSGDTERTCRDLTPDIWRSSGIRVGRETVIALIRELYVTVCGRTFEAGLRRRRSYVAVGAQRCGSSASMSDTG